MGRFIAEPLGEQPIGSEGSSWPALRTYLLGYILREPQSTSANLLDDVGGRGLAGVLFLGGAILHVGSAMQISAGLIHEGYSALVN